MLMPASDATAEQWLTYALDQPTTQITWALNQAIQADANLMRYVDDAITALNQAQRYIRRARDQAAKGNVAP